MSTGVVELVIPERWFIECECVCVREREGGREREREKEFVQIVSLLSSVPNGDLTVFKR